ncbi:MAG: hypothetical protein ILP10_07915 [Lachnospiraceae bacterium]|nr:hypothetical protein [Lachnospiraceae bacterium]
MGESMERKKKTVSAAVLIRIAAALAAVFFFAVPIAAPGQAGAASFADNGARMIDNGDGTQTLVYIDMSGVTKEVLNFDLRDETYLIMTGKHNPSQSRWHYYTTAYNFTGKSTNKDMAGYSGTKVRIERLSPEPDVMVGGMLRTTYKIRWEDVIEAAKKCFTPKQLRGKVTLYMSNIFQVRDRDNGDRQYGSDISDYAVMANRSGSRRSLPGDLQWSDNTLRLLPAYYDIPITIEKVFYSMSVLKTNCSECARNYMINGFKKKGMTYCRRHDARSVWFEFESAGTDDGQSKFAAKKSKFTSNVDAVLEVGGRTYEVDAVTLARSEPEGYCEVKDCDTFFSYYDTLPSGGTALVGKAVRHSRSTQEGAVYRFYKKNNRKFAVVVERDKPHDGVVIIPYREVEEPDTHEHEPVITGREAQAGRKELAVKDISYMDPGAEADIRSDIFETEVAIPSTEELIAEVITNRYLVDASFETVSGTKNYIVPVILPYSITYKGPSFFELNEETGEYTEVPGSDIVVSGSVSGTMIVSRDYSFTQIRRFDMYTPTEALIKNGALPDEEIGVNADIKGIPEVRFERFADGEEGHLKDPDNISATIVLPLYTYSSGSTDYPGLPVVTEDYRSYVESRIGQVRARNDMLKFGSRMVLDPSYRNKDAVRPDFTAVKAPEKCAPSEFSARADIPAERRNETFESTGTVYYEKKVSAASIAGTEKSFRIEEINPVHVHTPVVCDGVVTSDNRKYLQLHDYAGDAVPIVAGRSDAPESEGHENDSCDFYVRVSNYGTHIHEKGYGTRDYLVNQKGVSGAYIKGDMNLVRFPFDVMLDVGSDHREANDVRISAGSWYHVGTRSIRCYIEDTVKDGIYYVDFKTVAVNAGSSEGPSMQSANTSDEYYIATDSVKVQVSGKIFDLRLTDVEDRLEWEDLGCGFTVGGKNELGIPNGVPLSQTIPIVFGQSTEAPSRGVLKSGYDWDFTFQTRGSTHADPGSIMEIVPTFWHVGEDGRGRQEVDLYYNELVRGEALNLVRIGSDRDRENRTEDDGYVFTYGKIRLCGQGDFWFFTYRLPETFHVAPKGTDVESRAKRFGVDYTEDFWIRGGYVIVNFSITCVDRYGKKVSSYSNTTGNVAAGCCSMWRMEGSPVTKRDWYGVDFTFREGDVVVLYNGYGRDDDHLTERLG